MAAAYTNLYLEQGTSFSTTITLDDVYGDVYDLVGYTAASQMRKSYYSSNSVATFTISIVTPSRGIITMDLNSAHTTNIAAGRYVYDVLVKDSANTIIKVLEGIVNVLPQVTKF